MISFLMHQCIDARLLRLNEERRSNTYTLASSYHVLTLLTSYIIHTYHVVSTIYSKVLCSFRMLQAMIIPSIITTMEVQLFLNYCYSVALFNICTVFRIGIRHYLSSYYNLFTCLVFVLWKFGV